MPEIIFLMGKSATGKDHIYEQLAHDEQLHLKRITMYTTRPMRAGEAEGVEYHFVFWYLSMWNDWCRKDTLSVRRCRETGERQS